jgi:ketosteroid isomerase-like protein
MLNKAVITGVCIVLTGAAGAALAQSADAPPGLGCGPNKGDGKTPAERAAIEAVTRKVAEGFVHGTVQDQDRLLAPNAIFWALGLGYLDRSKYVEIHHPKAGPLQDTPKPLSHKMTYNSVVVEGEYAVVDMENKMVFPNFTYDQYYSTHVQVQDGKICNLKEFTDSSMAKGLFPNINSYIIKK